MQSACAAQLSREPLGRKSFTIETPGVGAPRMMPDSRRSRSRPPVLASIRFQEHAAVLKGRSLSEIFSYIYRTNLWGGSESRSGVGSGASPTRLLRREIPRLCHELRVRVMLDVPCGDFSWLSAAELDLDYIGADIVADLVNANRRQYASEKPRRSFLQRDLTVDRLPTADLVLCRDGLVHLSFEDISRALENLKRSHSRYLLTTTFTELEENRAISSGDWRPLNLQRPPFSFPKPIRSLVEGCTEEDGAYADKALALWEISCLPELAA